MAAALKGSVLDPKWPVCPALDKMPETPEELFRALGGTIEEGRYAFPWAGYKGWRDAGERLTHFIGCNDTAWTDFNDSAGNEGIMTASGHPDKALVENLMNGFDAKLEHLAADYLEKHKGETSLVMPNSPFEAVKMWSGGFSPDQLPDMKDQEIEDLSKESLVVRLFADPKKTTKALKEDSKCIVDIRDYGCGITPEAMVKTILSLNRSGPTSKKNKPWVSGKHGQGAGGTYQYAQISLIATRVWGSDIVAFTVVTRQFDNATVKTPTFKYLTVGGKVLTFKVKNDADFPPGLLIRHIGYKGDLLVDKTGVNSLYGLIQRALPQPLYPVRFQHHVMQLNHHEGCTHGPGHGDNRHIYGAVNALHRATHRTSNPDPNRTRKAQEFKPTYSTTEIIKLGDYDFGGLASVGMTEVAPAGYVTMTAWAIDPRLYNDKGEHIDNASSTDVLKGYVNPTKPVLFTLDGQTHAEEYQFHITSENKGAGLWRIGQYMVVHIDCNGLTRDGRYELFSSLRETTKKTPLQTRIMEEVIDRLKNTPKFQELQSELAVAVKSNAEKDEDFAKGFKDWCSRSNIPLDQLTIRKIGWRTVWERQLGIPEKKTKGKPVPIDPKEPPTFIRWAFNGQLPVKMYPGQTYSWTLLTDAHPDYWKPLDPAHSKIRVSTIGIEDRGGDTVMVGGRVLCRFRCPKEAVVGSDRLIMAQIDGLPVAELPIKVVEKPAVPKPPGGPNKPLVCGTPNKKSKEYVMVRVRRKGEIVDQMPIVRPVAVTRKDPPGQWTMLGWDNPDEAGLSVREEQDGVRIYYNAELPNFLKFADDFTKKGALDLFRQTYEYKLVMYAVFHLNHEVVFETAVDEDRKPDLRILFTSVADDLVYEAQREVTSKIEGIKNSLKTVDG